MKLLSHWLFFIGGEGLETSMFHKHIAQKTANETEEKCEKVQIMIRWKLSFLRVQFYCVLEEVVP